MQRKNCPCCSFPTLERHSLFEICELCDWEDDGQDDQNADNVYGGPNGDYSLTEARANFKVNLIMYRDEKNISSQPERELRLKKALIDAFNQLAIYALDSPKYKIIWDKIILYERELLETLN